MTMDAECFASPPPHAEATMDIEAGLNEEQKEAVHCIDKPLLVLAGAGTGKTRVLTTRIAHIVNHAYAYPSQILAVTFTNKAAREMKDRINQLCMQRAEGMWLGTFHSIAARMLRHHAEMLGFTPQFTIIDTDDQIRLLKQLMAEQDVDSKEYTPRKLAAIISRWKDKGLLPENVRNSDIPDFAEGKSLELYQSYQARLHSLNAMDFGDLLLLSIRLFTSHTQILASYHQRFRYILVDEYQDTNIAQYLWLRLLAQGQANICCVGDDDQSIYGWRGAEVGNILKFERDFPTAKTVRLERNYRSTSPILGAASGLIAANKERLGKVLWTDADTDASKVRVTEYYNDLDEARYIAEEIESLQRSKQIEPKEIAVLVRAGFQTRLFEERFIAFAIPYRVVGGLRFYERMEIRDAIAYIRLMTQESDDLAFERIINTPKRGVGNATLQRIFSHAHEHHIPMLKAMRQLLDEGAIKGKAALALQQLHEGLVRWKKLLETTHHSDVIHTLLEESGYLAMWEQQQTEEAKGRIENIKEFLSALQEFDSITNFLDHVSLVTDIDTTDEENLVNIMTLHAAKGLEFDSVFLPGWEEGIFPNQRALQDFQEKALEEERRLAYVGITRAKKYCYISYASSRRVFGQYQHNLPSCFVAELPEEHIETSYNSSINQSKTGHWNQSSLFPQQHKTHNQPDAEYSPSHIETFCDEIPDEFAPTYCLNDRIFHQKFGYGHIQAIDGDVASIRFDKAGNKKVKIAFIRKA